MRAALLLSLVFIIMGSVFAAQKDCFSAEETLKGLPLYFVENQGQLHEDVAYYLPGSDKNLYFTAHGVTFALAGKERGWAVKLDFVDARPDARPLGEALETAVISYFKGKASEWKAGLPTYGKLVYKDLWPGIDLEYSGKVGRLKYEFVVKPGADPSQIRLRYRGVTQLSVEASGVLKVTTPVAGLEDGTPYAFQEINSERKEVAMAYARLEQAGEDQWTYGFDVGSYDESRTLILDPVVLAYCGYIGGVSNDEATDLALDEHGNIYITGSTSSPETSFPVVAGPDLTFNSGGADAFVAKINASGTSLYYCGFIGGAGLDNGYGIAVDKDGCAHVTGSTGSTETHFPIIVGPDLTYNGGDYDAFVAKVNALGTGLEYCGYIGGALKDYGNDIVVGSKGRAYVVGQTESDEGSFPVAGGPGLTYNGGSYDVFVARVEAIGNALDYCGYIGGNDGDFGQDIAVDDSNRAYVTGGTYSTNLSTTIGPDLTHNGNIDAFVGCVAESGSTMEYLGYIGGDSLDSAYGLDVDGGGAAYVTGFTQSTESSFPVVVGPDLTQNGFNDAFIAKVNPSGANLQYCGFIGGTKAETGLDVALDVDGCAYLVGPTRSDESSFPVTVGPDLTFNGGWDDAFVAKVNASGTAIDYCGYIGGDDRVSNHFGIDVSTSGDAYVAGSTESTESTFPVTHGPDLTFNGGTRDAFVARVHVGQTIYVDGDNVAGPWDGSMQYPFRYIKSAMKAVLSGDTVLVYPGTYHARVNFAGKNFTLKSIDGPSVTTINAGEIDSVITFVSGETRDAVLQGFTITNGAALTYKQYGGGIYCSGASPTIMDNVFVKNDAMRGGGMYLADSSALVKGNVIAENKAEMGGGIFVEASDDRSKPLVIEDNEVSENDANSYAAGIYIFGTDLNPHWPEIVTVRNNTISGNFSMGWAGGVYCHDHARPLVKNNVVTLNGADQGGGGICCAYYADAVIEGNVVTYNKGYNGPGGGIRADNNSWPAITNNMIHGNDATMGAGIFCIFCSNALITNNTITENTSIMMGGAFASRLSCTPTMTNCIIWNNPADSNVEIYLEQTLLTISHSDVKGGQASVYLSSSSLSWGSGMIDADPLFVDPLDDDYHLSHASPCIDAGDSYVIILPELDFEGDPRIFQGNGKGHLMGLSPQSAMVDMGADEYCLLKRQKFIVK